MTVSDKFSCLCRKSPKKKSAQSEGFVNYLQIDSHNYQELINLKMWKQNYSFVSRTHWPEDVSILASTHKPEDTRMWGHKDTNKHTWTWGYDDVRRMQGYKLAHMNLRIWGCKDVRIEANTWTWGFEDVRTQGYKHTRTWQHKDSRMQERAYEPEDTRM